MERDDTIYSAPMTEDEILSVETEMKSLLEGPVKIIEGEEKSDRFYDRYFRKKDVRPKMSDAEIIAAEKEMKSLLGAREDKYIEVGTETINPTLKQTFIKVYEGMAPIRRDEVRDILGFRQGKEYVGSASYNETVKELRTLFMGIDDTLTTPRKIEGDFFSKRMSLGEVIRMKKAQKEEDKLINFLKEIAPGTRELKFKHKEYI